MQSALTIAGCTPSRGTSVLGARCLGDMYVFRKHVYMPPRRLAQRRVWPRHRGCSCP